MADCEKLLAKKHKKKIDPHLAKMALLVIEALAMYNSPMNENVVADIFRFAHVAIGGCVEHKSWREKLISTYEQMKADEVF